MSLVTADLTDDEATFLSLLTRIEPSSAYQLSKIYEASPVSNFGTSKGKVYPLVRRLHARGLIVWRKTPKGGRNSGILRSTVRGRNAVRKWTKTIKPQHVLPEDALRTMVQSFDLLSYDEQLGWILQVRSVLDAKLTELEEYTATVYVPYKDLVHDNAVTSVKGRLEWLGRLESFIVTRKGTGTADPSLPRGMAD